MADPAPGVRSTVVVVTWRGRDHIEACLAALAAQDRPHSTLIVDNASADGTADLIARQRVLRLNRNRGYAGGIAAALTQVRTTYVAWLNDDAEPAPAWLAELEDALDADPGSAAAGSVLTDRHGQITSAGVRLTDDGHGTDADTPTPGTFGFCGGAALLRTDALRSIGGVPADFFCYYEDTDTAWRLRLTGWQVRTVPNATAVHRHGASSQLGSFRFHRWNERNRLLMLLRCAPAPVAIHQLARFVAVTTMLPFRRTDALNFTARLRLLVLAEVLLRLPTTLLARWRIGRRATVRRKVIWRTWAGR